MGFEDVSAGQVLYLYYLVIFGLTYLIFGDKMDQNYFIWQMTGKTQYAGHFTYIYIALCRKKAKACKNVPRN